MTCIFQFFQIGSFHLSSYQPPSQICIKIYYLGRYKKLNKIVAFYLFACVYYRLSRFQKFSVLKDIKTRFTYLLEKFIYYINFYIFHQINAELCSSYLRCYKVIIPCSIPMCISKREGNNYNFFVFLDLGTFI